MSNSVQQEVATNTVNQNFSELSFREGARGEFKARFLEETAKIDKQFRLVTDFVNELASIPSIADKLKIADSFADTVELSHCNREILYTSLEEQLTESA